MIYLQGRFPISQRHSGRLIYSVHHPEAMHDFIEKSPARGFPDRRGKFRSLSFNHLPERPLPDLHDNAQLIHARK
jgi:hypothetical protein